MAASVTIPSDDRSVLATAYGWAWRIIVVSLEMVLPGLAGYWVDTRLGTVCLFLLIGLTVGSVAAIRHLIKLARESSEKRT
jgi:F0F1-type ATP synthase assembly protein I